MDGLLVVDKPAGPTSHDVVARVRRLLGERRVGHTGTLDPSATGVLPLVVGRATRLARFLSGADKEYEAVIALGSRTTTYDGEGEPVGERWSGPMPSSEEVGRALDGFRGAFEQRPPAFSAKKIGGTRSYTLARAAERRTQRLRGAALAPGAEVLLANIASPSPVSVTVRSLDLLSVAGDRVTLRLVCSAGFYVRSLANDLGERLGIGAYLLQLRRLRSGEYDVSASVGLEAAERDRDLALRAILPMERLLTSWSSVVLDDEILLRRVRAGQHIATADPSKSGEPGAGTHVRLVDGEGRLVGIAEREAPGVLHPVVVFM